MFVDRDTGGRVFFARSEFKVASVRWADGKWAHHAEQGQAQLLLGRVRATGNLRWDVPPECPVGATVAYFRLISMMKGHEEYG